MRGSVLAGQPRTASCDTAMGQDSTTDSSTGRACSTWLVTVWRRRPRGKAHRARDVLDARCTWVLGMGNGECGEKEPD